MMVDIRDFLAGDPEVSGRQEIPAPVQPHKQLLYSYAAISGNQIARRPQKLGE
jgi:hypothetical protein